MSDQERLLAVIDKLYEAVWDRDQWPTALQLYADLIGARGAHLLLAERKTGAVLLGVVAGFSEEINNEYVKQFSALDERIPRVLKLPLRRPAQHHELYLDGERRRSATYNEFLSKYDGEEQALVRLKGPEGTEIVLGSIRGAREGPFEAEELRLSAAVFPHIERAVALSRQLFEAESQKAAMCDALDLAPFGVLLLDEAENVMFANHKAREITARADGLSLRHGRLSASRPAENRMLQGHVAAAVAGDAQWRSGLRTAISVTRNEAVHPYGVNVLKLPRNDGHFAALRPAAIVFVHDPSEKPRSHEMVLAGLYGLSPREAELTSAIVSGGSVKGFAADAGITENTARSLLKRIFEKTSCRSQPDLVRLVVSGPAVFAGGDAETENS